MWSFRPNMRLLRPDLLKSILHVKNNTCCNTAYCGGSRNQLGKGKGEAKLIVNSEKKETMVYNAKEEILKAKFLYGY